MFSQTRNLSTEHCAFWSTLRGGCGSDAPPAHNAAQAERVRDTDAAELNQRVQYGLWQRNRRRERGQWRPDHSEENGHQRFIDSGQVLRIQSAQALVDQGSIDGVDRSFDH